MSSRAHSTGWTSSGGLFEGFHVDTDGLAQVVRVLTQVTDILLRADETDSSGTVMVHDSRVGLTATKLKQVPAWLHDDDRRWQAQRDRLLDAHDHAAQALRETARAYLGSESRAVGLLAIDAAAGTNPSPTGMGPPPALDPSPNAEDAGFPNSAASSARAGVRPFEDGGDLDTAVELWRRRGDSARTAMEMLRRELSTLQWHGAAATAFTSWTDAHLDSCLTLLKHADTVHAALTSPDPTTPRIADSPEARAPRAFPPDPAQPRDAPSPTLPTNPTSATSPTAPPTAPPIETAAAMSSGDFADAASETGPNAAVTAPAAPPSTASSRDGQLDDKVLELAYAGPAPDGPTAQSRTAEPADDRADREQAIDAAAPLLPQSVAEAAMWPAVAIATTALFARTDRGHHVVRDIALPPTPGLPLQPGTAARPGAVVPHERRGYPSASPRPHGDTTAHGQPAPTGGRESSFGRPMPPFHGTPAAVWINLARPHDPPAWLDLAAARGLGLDGPGAFDIARTVWRRLHHDYPRARLITPEQVARDLLGYTVPRLDTDDRLLVVRDPRQGLEASWHEVEHRRTIGLHSSPVVLIAPAPTTASARSDLSTTLRHFPHGAFTAVLLGAWDTGTTVVVTEQHQVSDHRHPASRLPPLTGAHLEPTTLDMLAVPNPTSEQSDTADHDPATDDQADLAASVKPPAERTPLALSVLGPVQLLYRRPATGSRSTEPDEPEPEEVLAIQGISRPAQELLAYLAAHPGGATRDAIIEALWPNSVADRPDTAFHTTISRLRKRLRDVTGTDTTGDVITSTDGRWHLHRAHVTVDYWTFLETHTRNPDPALRRHDHHIAVRLYHGPFAADQTGEWTHTIREATRRRYLEALNDLTESEIATDPDLALDLLERARNLEPLNEAIYRNIMRIHIAGHRPDAARGVYELLRTHLATIEATPEPATEQLAATAQQGQFRPRR